MGASDFWTKLTQIPDADLAANDTSAAPSAKSETDQLEFNLSIGRNNRDIYPAATSLTIGELAQRWGTPDTGRGRLTTAEYHALRKTDSEEKKRRDQEKNGEWFSPAEFGRDGRRCDENVVSLAGMTLDFDTGKTTREVIEKTLDGMAYVAYTSYSHRPEAQRWRVFIPYAHPIEPGLHRAVYEHFQKKFGGDVDPKCATPSQIYYTPACPHDAEADYQCIRGEGDPFDPQSVGASAINDPRMGGPPIGATKNAPSTSELIRIKGALSHLDPDDRGTWIEIGMAIKHAFGDEGMATWMDWSQRSPKFETQEVIDTWQSLKPKTTEGAITLGSVYRRAKEAGWIDEVESVPAEIADLNRQYFVAPYGRKVPIFRETQHPQSGELRVEPMLQVDFRTLLANRKVLVRIGQNTKQIPLADYWLQHQHRRQYDGVHFAPGSDIPGYYNRWRGFAVVPKKGDWRRFRWHLFAVVCNGNRHRYRYLLNWLAWSVQNPGTPPGVAIVLKGGRGVGKGIVVNTFGQLFGPSHYRHVSNPKHVTGNFNAHFEGCVVLFVDEGHWAGDKAGEGVLKQLITEPNIMIERKGFDVEMEANTLHLMIASNNDWVVPAGPDERRFMVLDVSDSKQQDHQHFLDLLDEMNKGGREAMLYDLLRRDLSKFNIRRVPSSKALGEQKLLSFEPHQKWWYEKLLDGRLIVDDLVDLH